MEAHLIQLVDLAPSHATMPVTWDDAAIPSASSDASWDEAAVRRRTVKQLVGGSVGKEGEGWMKKLQEKEILLHKKDFEWALQKLSLKVCSRYYWEPT